MFAVWLVINGRRSEDNRRKNQRIFSRAQTVSWGVFGLWVRNSSIWFVLCGSGFDSSSGVLGLVEVSSFVVRVLLDFHFTLCFLGFYCKVATLGFLLSGKKGFGSSLSQGKKDVGFFLFG